MRPSRRQRSAGLDAVAGRAAAITERDHIKAELAGEIYTALERLGRQASDDVDCSH
jgi:hypothetical protein